MPINGSSYSDGFVEPKQQGHQATLLVAESTLALDTWRGGKCDPLQVEARTDASLRYDGYEQINWNGSKRIYPL